MALGHLIPVFITLLLSSATVGGDRAVGCYWYPKQCIEPGMALTDRNISDLPLDTCTYLDIGNLCFFNVTADGTLNHAQPGCREAMEGVVADVLRTKKKQSIRAYYELWDVTFAAQSGCDQHNFCRIFSNSTLLESFVRDLADWVKAHPGAVDGFNVDWELSLNLSNPKEVAARQGFTTFLKRLKEETQLGVSMDIGALSGFENIAEVSKVQPYVDYVEFMSYFVNLTTPLTNVGTPAAGNSILQNIHDLLAPPNNYRADQIIVGVGLSSQSVVNVSLADAPSCAYWGWGCGPMTSAKYSTTNLHTKTWDLIKADVTAGKGIRGQSGAKQGFAHWYFFPNKDTPNKGELTWWNDESDLDYYTGFVNEHTLGGVFSWIATSDAPDWRIHKRLNKAMRPGSSLYV